MSLCSFLNVCYLNPEYKAYLNINFYWFHQKHTFYHHIQHYYGLLIQVGERIHTHQAETNTWQVKVHSLYSMALMNAMCFFHPRICYPTNFLLLTSEEQLNKVLPAYLMMKGQFHSSRRFYCGEGGGMKKVKN